MRKWLIVLFALSITTAGAGPAWTWKDSNGQVHYSDTPVPGATRIELGSAQGFGQAQGGAQRRSAQAQSPQASTQTDRAYSAVTIVSPTQQQTLWNTGGEVSVQVATEPSLRPGDRVDLTVDGQRRNLDASSTQLTLKEVVRGIHTVEAVVVDGSGKELVRSAPTTFIVQQTSIAKPR